jgi:primosomal protein N' (replication factor Y)
VTSGRYVDVIVQVEVPNLRQPFTYAVPDRLDEPNPLQSGDCVVVPFGRQVMLGYVVQRRDALPDGVAVKAVRDVLERVVGDGANVPDSVMRTARWVAREYVADLAMSIRTAIPQLQSARIEQYYAWTGRRSVESLAANQQDFASFISRAKTPQTLKDASDALQVNVDRASVNALIRIGAIERNYQILPPKVTARSVMCVTLAVTPDVAFAEANRRRRRAKQQANALEMLAGLPAHTPVSIVDALEAYGIARAIWKRLETDLLVEIAATPVDRVPLVLTSAGKRPDVLSPDQIHALAVIGDESLSTTQKPILLHGVTGSGKTEVYLATIEKTLAAGRTALVLVPEIALTAQLMGVFRGRLGNRVAVLHSALSDGERRDEWHRIGAGKADVVVGARSAIFAPLSNIGCIIVDEEHEGSYKQESGAPRYQARDVALARARSTNAAVILGSATPNVESYFKATSGDYTLAEMTVRPAGRPMPYVEIIDQRIKSGATGLQMFSPSLLDAISESLGAGQQAIVFLNRRGFAKYLLCRECGHVPMCPNCAVSLTLHHGAETLLCHHCAYTLRTPDTCPSCTGKRILSYGIGTERIEAELKGLFPNARLLRMDRDTVGNKDALPAMIEQFRTREADILIGTQMVAKGLDFPGVTCVGVVAADTSLHVPDFRASERTFQLLAQVSGRAGRGDVPGRVMIQTFNPDHVAIQAAAQHDYGAFYGAEIENRRELNYPPFSRLCNVIANHEDANTASGAAAEIATRLRLHRGLTVLGPAPCPLSRVRNKHRFHVLIKGPLDDTLRQLVRRELSAMPSDLRSMLMVDIDPQSVV